MRTDRGKAPPREVKVVPDSSTSRTTSSSPGAHLFVGRAVPEGIELAKQLRELVVACNTC